MPVLIFPGVSFLFCLVLFFYSLTPFSVWSEQVETSTLSFKVNYVAPSCHITVPAEVDLGNLGSLPQMTIQHPPFALSVNCPVQRDYSLYASVVGHPTEAWYGYVLMDREDGGPVLGGTSQRLSPSLFLDTQDGEQVFLNGQLAFCKNKATCVIVPTTYVDTFNIVPGSFSTSIRFTMKYH